ncbi:hypothetical protein GTY67_33415 [Streptomyces sp. SID8374]|nr:hypothetical protein [Streptomyces sp. SID4937]MYX18251.1 hypothetical protein [Streptomyces sp. SID8374]SCD59424.1 hypothetical protein GA0115243_1033110 [Streptomyces sp. ScaeMP-e83]
MQQRSETAGAIRARRAQPARSASASGCPEPPSCALPSATAVTDNVLELRMPAAFMAFCTRRMTAYTRFATVCTGCRDTGTELAQEALGDLAAVWEKALRSPSPAAVSWDLLSVRGSARARSRPGGSVYRLMPRLHGDAVVLRYRLGLTLPETAELMGVGRLELNGMLRYATRRVLESGICV